VIRKAIDMTSDHATSKTATISIDGRPYPVTDLHTTAADLLRLAGVDPAQYDLGKLKPGGEPQIFRDDHPIELHDGDKFVTVRQSAPVA
jgi:hypothetical protein